MKRYRESQNLRRDQRAVTPALSSIILTCAVILMVMVAMFFANGVLQSNLSESDYKANKQFMLTEGLQIDDVAWTIGRTQTSIFSSKYGAVSVEPVVLTYTFEAKTGGSNWIKIGNYTTGIVMFSMPTSVYTLGNGYFNRIFPSNSSFLQEGATVPVSQVFTTQKNSLQRGSDIRIIAAPTIRLLSSTIKTDLQQTNYIKLYLPVLVAGHNPFLSQSVTQTGNGISKVTQSGATQIRVNASIPVSAQSSGYDLGDTSSSCFFRFQSQSITYPSSGSLPPNSIIELYIANVTVAVGLAT
jgi:hypothetical protein